MGCWEFLQLCNIFLKTHFKAAFLLIFLSAVDQSMFENSVAQQPSPQTSRSNQPGARRSSANSASADSPSSGGQQRLKNAINLGKAVGAKVGAAIADVSIRTRERRLSTPSYLNRLCPLQVNDLLRRKEPSHLGDIGVTEVNKNVATAWSSTNQLAAAANRCTQTPALALFSFQLKQIHPS